MITTITHKQAGELRMGLRWVEANVGKWLEVEHLHIPV